MLKKLLPVVVLLFLTPLIATLLNKTHHTAVFNACPDTEYCSDLGRTQRNDPVKIEYAGWPFKVKIGNPDWCENGPCEGNKYHPDYKWEYFAYNALVIAAPAVLALGAILFLYDQKHFRKIIMLLGVIIVSTLLAWLTVKATRTFIIWNFPSTSIGDSRVLSGIPLPSELHMASGCYASEGIERINCSRENFSDTPLWHSEARLYINWVFWSFIWMLIIKLGMRKYAHTRN